MAKAGFWSQDPNAQLACCRRFSPSLSHPFSFSHLACSRETLSDCVCVSLTLFLSLSLCLSPNPSVGLSLSLLLRVSSTPVVSRSLSLPRLSRSLCLSLRLSPTRFSLSQSLSDCLTRVLSPEQFLPSGPQRAASFAQPWKRSATLGTEGLRPPRGADLRRLERPHRERRGLRARPASQGRDALEKLGLGSLPPLRCEPEGRQWRVCPPERAAEGVLACAVQLGSAESRRHGRPPSSGPRRPGATSAAWVRTRRCTY
jgi:hypothetical protein